MLVARSKLKKLTEDLLDLCDAVDAVRKEEENPVPCHVMKKITKEHLFKRAKEIKDSLEG